VCAEEERKKERKKERGIGNVSFSLADKNRKGLYLPLSATHLLAALVICGTGFVGRGRHL
jgi:hypothetical protein